MTIRTAREDDWPRIGALAEILVQTHHAFDAVRFIHPDTLRADLYLSHLREEVAGGQATVIVAEHDGTIAGYVFAGLEPESWKELRAESGYIHDLVVDERHRRAGIGEALLAAAVDWFDARNVGRVMLWTAPSNERAQRLFHRAGFRRTMIEMTLDRPSPSIDPKR